MDSVLLIHINFAVRPRRLIRIVTACTYLNTFAINEDCHDLRSTIIKRRNTPIVSISEHGLLSLVTQGLYLRSCPPLSDLA